MGVLQKASNVVVVCVTVLVLAAMVGVVVLLYKGQNATAFTGFIGNILSGLAVLGSGGAFLYASAGAKSANNTEQQLNGNLDIKIAKAVQTALVAHDIEVHGVQPQLPPPINAPSSVEGSSGTS